MKPTVVASVHHILQQIEHAKTLAAADHLLVCQSKNNSHTIIKELMKVLPEFIENHPGVESHVFEAIIRIGLNLVGLDAKIAGIPAPTVRDAIRELRQGLPALESRWSELANGSVNSHLAAMLNVNSGDSLPAFMAEEIRERLGESQNPSSFIDAFGQVARQTVY